MEQFLQQFKDKQIDIAFGTSATVRGVVKEIKDGILQIEDEEKRTAYVAIEKIAVVWEADDTHSRPGFVS